MSDEKTPCPMSETLIAYLYRELSAEEAMAFEAHVTTCAQCAQDLRDFQRVRQALAEWQVAGAVESEASRPRLREAVRQLLRALPAWGRVALGGATILFLLALFNVQLEWTPEGGFRFRASLFPPRAVEPLRPSEMSAPERQQMRALIEDMMRDVERRQQEALAASVRELTERMHREQRAALAELVREWEIRQRAHWAVLLRELERRRYGALTFADLFFNTEGQ
jgi:hypothetical protein